MLLLQSIAVIFGLFMLYVVRIHRRKNNLESFEYGIWLALWCGFIFLSIFPQLTTGVAQVLHIARVFDLLVIIAFMILTTISFMDRIAIKKLEKKFEELVRSKALHAKK